MRAAHAMWVAAVSAALLAGTCAVTVHAQPILVATIANGGAHAIDIHDTANRTYAVAAGYKGVQITDITDPAKPMPVAVIPHDIDGFPVSYIPDDIDIHDIANRTYAVMTGYKGVQITDITDPAKPVPVTVLSYDADRFATMNQPKVADVYDTSGRTHVVVGSRGGVQVVDITQPSNPAPVATILDDDKFRSLDGVKDVIIHEMGDRTHAFVTTTSLPICGLTCTSFPSLRVIDITSPNDPSPVSPVDVRWAGGGIAVHDISNRTYAVTASSSHSVHITDITRPADTIPVATISDDAGGFTELGGVADIAVHDISNRTYAVTASSGDNGVQIIDIASPADPVPIAALNDDTGGFTTLGGVRTVNIHDISNRTYAVVGGHEGLQIIDIASLVPAAATPVPAACHIPAAAQTARLSYGGLRWVDDIAVHDISNRTYAVVVDSGRVKISDITNPADPVRVTTIEGDTGGFTKFFRAKDVAVWDISNRTYAVVSGAIDSVQIVEITDPAHPALVVAMFDEGSYVHDLELQMPNPAAILTDSTGGFTELAGAHGIAVHDISNRTYAMVASSGDNGVQIIDITDPADPLPVAALSDAAGFTDLDGGGVLAIGKIHDRTYAMVASNFDNIVLIDMTDPESPVTVPSDSTDIAGGFSSLNWTSDVATTQISDKIYTVVASSLDNVVYITDVTDPASPTPVASVTASTGGFAKLAGAHDIAVHDISNRTYAAVASRLDSGVQIIDITDPADPLPAAAIADGVGGFAELGGASDIAIHDISNRTYAVVASSGDNGVQIIDITDPADPLPAAAITDDVGGFTKLLGAADADIHDISNGTYAVISGYEGVQIIDITDPASPLPAAWLSGSYSAAIHDVSGKAHLLVSHSQGSVGIIDIEHPAAAGCLHNR